MDGAQFNISVITGGSNAAISSIVAGLDSITNHLNTLNKNFVSASQQNVAALDKISSGAARTESSLSKMGGAVFHLNQIQQGLSGITNDLNNAVEPGIRLNSSLADLQAITGVTDKQLEKLSDAARKNAIAFGITAAGSVESFKIYLSKLGPELANNEKALAGMGTNASILSKQLKGDVAGATEILTTAMNQFGVSIKDPNEALRTQTAMMNIMSKAAQEGSAELPQIASALEQSGMMAKTANVSFAELNASIQVLDKAGKKGAEGGVAIRNVLAEISQGKMMPRQQLKMLQAAGIDVEGLADKSKSFADRLRLLNPIVNDNAAMVKLFGKENVAAGIAAVQGANDIDTLTGKIKGTNSATKMANTIMGSYQEKMNRMKSAIEDYGISIFAATKPFMPFITMGMGAIQVLANLAMASTLVSTAINSNLIKSLFNGTAITNVFAASQAALNFILNLNPIFLIITGIGLLITGLVIAYNKSEKFRAVLSGIMEVGKLFFDVFGGMGKVLQGIFTMDMDKVKEGLVQTGAAVVNIANGGIEEAFNKGFDKSMADSAAAAALDKQKTSAEEIAKQNGLLNVNTPIDGITQQGVAKKGSVLDGYDPHKRKGKQGSELASNITSGGSKPTTIHLTIQKVIGIGEVKTTNMMNTAKQAGNMVVEEVLVALQSVNGKVSTQ
jgi:TP901 family phage tail tape measure protein